MPILPGIPATEVEAAIAGTSSAVFEKLDAGTRMRVVEAIIGSMDKVYGVVIAGGALTFVLAVFLPVSSVQTVLEKQGLMSGLQRQKLFIGPTAAG